MAATVLNVKLFRYLFEHLKVSLTMTFVRIGTIYHSL